MALLRVLDSRLRGNDVVEDYDDLGGGAAPVASP